MPISSERHRRTDVFVERRGASWATTSVSSIAQCRAAMAPVAACVHSSAAVSTLCLLPVDSACASATAARRILLCSWLEFLFVCVCARCLQIFRIQTMLLRDF